MNYPTRKFLGWTWVGWLNILLFQWFWCRLQAMVEDDNSVKAWQLIAPVAPLTGWYTKYWPKNRHTIRLLKGEHHD